MSKYPFERSCEECSVIFSISNAMFKNKRFCSLSCSTKSRGTRSKMLYQQSPKQCLLCQAPIPYEVRHRNKFCSSSCSCTYNNKQRTTEYHKRHGEKIKEVYITKPRVVKPAIGKPAIVEMPKTVKCIVCSQMFTVKNKNSTKKSCSRECQTVLYQKAGQKSANTRCLRSKKEIQLYNLCAGHYTDVKHNEVIVDGWDADIVIPNKKVAILWNGPWHYRQMPVSNHSLTQVQNRDRIKIKLFESLGWKVFVFEDRHFSPEAAFTHLVKHII